MRSFSHWTPAYILARSHELLYQKLHPLNPWLTPRSVELLSELIRTTDVMLELGAGRSTSWFARRVRHVTSIEDNQAWYDKVKANLEAEGLDNVDLVVVARHDDSEARRRTEYLEVVARLADASLDIVLIDGQYRDDCALAVLPKLKANAVLVIDNVNWYLPSNSISPNSRTFAAGPATEHWREFLEATRSWRRIWTSSGVTDTLILFA